MHAPTMKNTASDPRRATFTAKELAVFLGISKATVCRLNATGKIPRPVRWDRWTIEEWLAAGAPPRDKWEAMQAR